MSIKAASTPASFSLFAEEKSITPVCITTVRPRFFFILPIASTNFSKGTEPSGKQPPLIRHPTAPLFFSFTQRSKSASGVRAGVIVSKTFLLQCLHSKAQEEPVMEIEGKTFGDEQK